MMKITRKITGEDLERLKKSISPASEFNIEIELTPEELSKAYYEQEHEFDKQDCRNYVEEEYIYITDDGSLKGVLLDHYFDKKGYESFLDEMAYNERRSIDKIGITDVDMPTLMEEVFWDTFERMDKLEMPQDSVSVQKMFDYGYTWGGMLPITSKEIIMDLGLFHKMEIFELHTDGSESLCESEEDLNKDSMFGIHKTDWEKYLFEKEWAAFKEKYPEPRMFMPPEKEREYVNDLFTLCEKEGFADRFWDPDAHDGSDIKEHIGSGFVVTERCTEGGMLNISDLPSWNIIFEDGTETYAFPDEIIPSRMKEAGCPENFFAKKREEADKEDDDLDEDMDR